MCGRYVSAGSLTDLGVLLGVNPFEPGGDELLPAAPAAPSYNVAPTDPVPVILPQARSGPSEGSVPALEVAVVTWGLVPPWADPSTAARRINARIETVRDKLSFRRAVRGRRCLIPADGWYEWVREPSGRRQPFYLRARDGSPLAFAGLAERARRPDGSLLRSCTIVTGPAPDAVSWLHERAPIAVPAPMWSEWLDPAADVDDLLDRLSAAAAPELSVVPVSPAVNDVRADGPDLICPVAPSPALGPLPEQAALW